MGPTVNNNECYSPHQNVALKQQFDQIAYQLDPVTSQPNLTYLVGNDVYWWNKVDNREEFQRFQPLLNYSVQKMADNIFLTTDGRLFAVFKQNGQKQLVNINLKYVQQPIRNVASTGYTYFVSTVDRLYFFGQCQQHLCNQSAQFFTEPQVYRLPRDIYQVRSLQATPENVVVEDHRMQFWGVGRGASICQPQTVFEFRRISEELTVLVSGNFHVLQNGEVYSCLGERKLVMKDAKLVDLAASRNGLAYIKENKLIIRGFAFSDKVESNCFHPAEGETVLVENFAGNSVYFDNVGSFALIGYQKEKRDLFYDAPGLKDPTALAIVVVGSILAATVLAYVVYIAIGKRGEIKNTVVEEENLNEPE